MEMDAIMLKTVEDLRECYRNGVRDAVGCDVCATELRVNRDACVLSVLLSLARGVIATIDAYQMAFNYGRNDALNMMEERD